MAINPIYYPRARGTGMACTDHKALRDALAGVTGELEAAKKAHAEDMAKVWAFVRKLEEASARKDETIAEQAGRISELEAQLARHEGPHNPSSHRSAANDMRAAARKEARRERAAEGPPGSGGTPGRRPGHPGESHGREAEEEVVHSPDSCYNCDGTNMEDPAIAYVKTVSNLEYEPRVVTKRHVVKSRKCRKCGAVCVPGELGWGVPQSELGPLLVEKLMSIHSAPASAGSACRILDEVFGLRVCEATVQNAINVAAEAAEPLADSMALEVEGADYGNIDETVIPYNGRRAYVWCAGGRTAGGEFVACKVKAVPSRAGAVVDEHFGYDMPMTTDGYHVYKRYRERQRCFSHTIRESEHATGFLGGGRARPEGLLLHGRLQALYGRGKECQLMWGGLERHGDRPPPRIAAAHARLVADTLALAGDYRDAGYGAFATLLENAAPDLYTFVLHPGMEPTNNTAERGLRASVIARKVRQGLRTPAGLRTFGILMTCIMTWRGRGIGVAEGFRSVLQGEAAPSG